MSCSSIADHLKAICHYSERKTRLIGGKDYEKDTAIIMEYFLHDLYMGVSKLRLWSAQGMSFDMGAFNSGKLRLPALHYLLFKYTVFVKKRIAGGGKSAGGETVHITLSKGSYQQADLQGFVKNRCEPP